MKTHSTIVFIQVLALAVLLGCRPVVDMERPGDYGWYPDQKYYFSGTFESFWYGMNVNYVYWDLEPTGYWDNVWDTYKPKFDALSLVADLDDAKRAAYGYFEEMLSPLKDGHLSVTFNGGWNINPTLTKVDGRFNDDLTNPKNPRQAFLLNDWSDTPEAEYPEYQNYNFFEHTIAPNYLVAGTGRHSKFGNFRIATGHIPTTSGGFILYFYFSSFYLAQNIANTENQDRQEINNIIEKYLADIDDTNLEGVIFDMRGNMGGDEKEIGLVLNRLIHEPLLLAYTRYKNGPNRLDYKPWIPYYINHHPDPSKRVKKDIPVVALINDYSISCGEIMPLAVRFMPNGKGYLIGTRTWGATGPRVDNYSPATVNGGSFSNENGETFWQSVVQAAWQTKGRDGASYEGIGIEPDKKVEFNWNEFYGDGAGSGRDRQLAAAIKHIYPAYTAP